MQQRGGGSSGHDVISADRFRVREVRVVPAVLLRVVPVHALERVWCRGYRGGDGERCHEVAFYGRPERLRAGVGIKAAEGGRRR